MQSSLTSKTRKILIYYYLHIKYSVCEQLNLWVKFLKKPNPTVFAN